MSDYCTVADLALVGLSPALYESRPEIDAALIGGLITVRSSFAEDFLARFYRLPLLSWGGSLTIAVSQLVAYDLMCLIGHDPDQTGTSVWMQRRDEALATLERIAKFGGAGIVDSTPTAVESAFVVSSEPRRGW